MCVGGRGCICNFVGPLSWDYQAWLHTSHKIFLSFPFRALSFGQPIEPPERDNPAEKLYRCLLPNLPQYMIALLKVLLAAAPTSRSRNDSLNILVDVLPPEAPANIVESTQVLYVTKYSISSQ